MCQYIYFNICISFLVTYCSVICGLLSNGNSYVEMQLFFLLHPQLMKFLRIHEQATEQALKQFSQVCVSKACSTRHLTLFLGGDRLDKNRVGSF